MDMSFLIGALALGTLLIGLGVALVGKARAEQRLKDDSKPKSTLAADKSAHGKPADV